jgi:2-beta-glucuronyltransferase
MQQKKKVVLVTLHYWGTKRQAGFHHLAHAYWSAGWDVLFLTVHISWLTRLRGIDGRLAYPVVQEANRIIRSTSTRSMAVPAVISSSAPSFSCKNHGQDAHATHGQDGRATEGGVSPARESSRSVAGSLSSFVWMTPWHVTNPRNKLLNLLSRPFSRLYEHFPLGAAKDYIRSADLVIFESTPGLMLFDRFKRLNPRARFVYRASDDLELLKASPLVHQALEKAKERFDLISVPSRHALTALGPCRNISLHHHGLDKAIFDQPCDNPYESWHGRPAHEFLRIADRQSTRQNSRAGRPCHATNAVFVGCSHMDKDFLARAARLMPDWAFHVIGPLDGLPRAHNIIAYGEMPFLETVPYIKHADIGLQIRSAGPGVESLVDSLKVIQYTYCRLPIVAPEFLRCRRTNFCYYKPTDDNSIAAALQAAKAMDRTKVDTTGIHTWDELAKTIAGQ